MQQQFQLTRDVIFDSASPVIFFEQVLLDGLFLIVPIVIPLMIVALLTPIMMGGWNFSAESMSPKFSKMNPISGLKRMVGVQGLVELLKSIIKIALVFFVAGSLFKINLDQYLGLSTLSLESSIAKAVDLIGFCSVDS